MNVKIEGYRLVEFCNRLQTDTGSLEVLDLRGYAEVKPRVLQEHIFHFC